jgi:glycosyltransferase involved in cell wall biosynthesis
VSLPKPIRLTFLVRALDYGGAQRQLVLLAKALDKQRFDVTVIAFYSGQPLEQELVASGVRFIGLNKRGRWDLLGFLRRLVQQTKAARPDVLMGYLDIPNLLALLLRRFVRARVVWGIRASTIDLHHYDWLHRLAARTERIFARYADLIIVNSVAGLEQNVARGFPRAKMIAIPNGFDTETFRPNRAAGKQQRAKWNVAPGTKLIGIVGRLDPMKDHRNFFEAAARVSLETNAARFVCVGDGPASYREELKTLANELGIGEKIIWQDAVPDLRGIYNALDVLVSASSAEGFPNVVGEAMACGVPCVVTDAGDSAMLVGDDDCGLIVPPRNSEALAAGMTRCFALDQNEIGSKARMRIIENFSVQRLAELTESATSSLVNHPG